MIKGDGASFELDRYSFSSRPFVALEYEFEFLNKKVVYKIEHCMNVNDSISATMDTVKGKETKDQSVKNLFIYKPIMGNILKYTVEEYKDCSLEEIMECIEGDTIQTGTALVEENMAQTIRGENTPKSFTYHKLDGFLHRKELENVEKYRTYYIACRTSSGYHKKAVGMHD